MRSKQTNIFVFLRMSQEPIQVGLQLITSLKPFYCKTEIEKIARDKYTSLLHQNMNWRPRCYDIWPKVILAKDVQSKEL